MITQIITEHGTTVGISANGGYRRRREFYLKTTDVTIADGKIANTISDARNADILYFMDWKALSDSEQTAAVSQVWMLDEETNFWLPQ